MSTKLLSQIKWIVNSAIQNSNPVRIVIGQVESIDPVIISLNQKIVISESLIIRTQKITGLAVGDTAILLAATGGQKYIILDVMM